MENGPCVLNISLPSTDASEPRRDQAVLFWIASKEDKSPIHESQKFQLCAEASLGSEGPKGIYLD